MEVLGLPGFDGRGRGVSAAGRLNYSFKEYIAVFRDVFRNQSAQLDFAADFDTMKGAVLKALNQLEENEKEKEKK